MERLNIELRSSDAPTIASTLADASTYVIGSLGLRETSDAAGVDDTLRLTTRQQQLFVEPTSHSTLYVNGQQVTSAVRVQHGDWVTVSGIVYQIGLTPSSLVLDAAVASAQPSLLPHSSTTSATQVVIGRHRDCALIIDSPLVSREHARLIAQAGHWIIEDLGTLNGTFVNGRRIRAPVALKDGDRVGVATFLYRFTGDGLLADGEDGRVRIEAMAVTREIRDRSSGQPHKLLDAISVVIEPGEFVVIFGGSGSGKSTLLDALNGRRQATSGRVLYNGVDFYSSFDTFRATIGYVPQQDIVHRRIPVRRALEYTARLRLPPDTTEQEIAEYVAAVLVLVHLQQQADLLIDTPAPLSGGQLKRVSLASELIAKPAVLFLDEVTRGLDAGTDRQMMQTFAELADSGRTVVCVTHTLENIATCHLVALLHHGQLAYFGPPAAVQEYFGLTRLSDIYDVLATQPAADWSKRYQASPLYQRYVRARLSGAALAPTLATPTAAHFPVQRSNSWHQFKILTRRYIDLMLADRRSLAIVLLQAPVIGMVVGLVFDAHATPLAEAAAHGQMAFMLVLSAIWFGSLNAAREIVKELPVYLRERAVNLALAPYLCSKLLPLLILALTQCLLLLAAVSNLSSLHGALPARLAILTVAAFAASALGLAISAAVDSNDKAIAMVPLLLIPQVVFSNAVVTLSGANLWIAKLSMISFWAYDGMKSTLDAQTLAVRDLAGNAAVPVLASYAGSIAVMALMSAAFLVLAVVALKLKDRIA